MDFKQFLLSSIIRIANWDQICNPVEPKRNIANWTPWLAWKLMVLPIVVETGFIWFIVQRHSFLLMHIFFKPKHAHFGNIFIKAPSLATNRNARKVHHNTTRKTFLSQISANRLYFRAYHTYYLSVRNQLLNTKT